VGLCGRGVGGVGRGVGGVGLLVATGRRVGFGVGSFVVGSGVTGERVLCGLLVEGWRGCGVGFRVGTVGTGENVAAHFMQAFLCTCKVFEKDGIFNITVHPLVNCARTCNMPCSDTIIPCWILKLAIEESAKRTLKILPVRAASSAAANIIP
jgi:hypothetical protein